MWSQASSQNFIITFVFMWWRKNIKKDTKKRLRRATRFKKILRKLNWKVFTLMLLLLLLLLLHKGKNTSEFSPCLWKQTRKQDWRVQKMNSIEKNHFRILLYSLVSTFLQINCLNWIYWFYIFVLFFYFSFQTTKIMLQMLQLTQTIHYILIYQIQCEYIFYRQFPINSKQQHK